VEFRNRIIAYKKVRAADIQGAPWNWRVHPDAQRALILASVEELGFYDPLKVFDHGGALTLIDGQARQEIISDQIGPDTLIPVVVTDLTAQEAKLALLTHDPLAAEAELDRQRLDQLLAEVETESRALADFLAEQLAETGAAPAAAGVEGIESFYSVYLECADEAEQLVIVEELMRHGLNPRALTIPRPTPPKNPPPPPTVQAKGKRVVRECKIKRTPRVVQVEGIFDLPPAKKARREWVLDLTLDRPWQVGLIVGPSGSGKTTLARDLFGDNLVAGWDWPEDRALVDAFPAAMAASEVTGLLSSVGLSSPPTWVKPFAVLSNGEQFRATLARTLAEGGDLAVVDEFTSVVDRTVAKIGSAAVAKCVRASGRRFVAVTCHYDVEEWLQPDWRYDAAAGKLTWRSLRRRPEIEIHVRRADLALWPIFARHHYLSANLARSAGCFVGVVDGQPAAFVAAIHTVGRRSYWREHRAVCLPDFQGVGIGNAVSEFVAGMYVCKGKGYRSTTSHPGMIGHRARSPHWRMVRAPGLSGICFKEAAKAAFGSHRANDRLTASFEYIGPARPDDARALGVTE
jgi:ABC-type iron transport system FetAB ATPase subunit